jgi:hypothetical protein
MEIVFVPKNSYGGYHVRVLWRNEIWMIEGSKDDFYDLTTLGWSHFLDVANRDGYEKSKDLLLKNGFKLSV